MESTQSELIKRAEYSRGDIKQLRRLFENSNLTAAELMRIIKPYGFVLDAGGKHPRIIHVSSDQPKQRERITDRGNFFPIPVHSKNSISIGVLKGARAFVYERLPVEIKQGIAFTPLRIAA